MGAADPTRLLAALGALSELRGWLGRRLAHPRPSKGDHVGPSPVDRGRRRRLRCRPWELFADRGYDHNVYRRQLRQRGITPRTARRGVAHGSGLGKQRWVVERGLAWLHDRCCLRCQREPRC